MLAPREPLLRLTVSINLGAHSTRLTRSPTDLFFLDLGPTDMDGSEVVHALRGWTWVPIIIFSVLDTVRALDAGAHDYLTQPYGMDEQFARRRAPSKGQPGEDAPLVITETFTIDLAAKRVPWRQRGAAHASEVTSPGGPDPALGEPGPRQEAPPGSLGPRLWRRDELPAGLYGPATSKARVRAFPSPPLITEPDVGYRVEP
jgi:CheY-like chemotaxis protein